MSKIELNSIKVIRSKSNTEPFLYVGAIVESQSGYLEPMIINSSGELKAIFGEIKDIHLYQDLIENGIPICILPVTTGESEFNKMSLRLLDTVTDTNGIKYTYPKLDRHYNSNTISTILSEDESIIKDIVDGKLTYCTILDFTDVEDSEIYKFRKDTNSDYYMNINYYLSNGLYSNQLISNNPNLSIIPADYHKVFNTKDPSINKFFNTLSFTTVTNPNNQPNDIYEVISNLKSTLNYSDKAIDDDENGGELFGNHGHAYDASDVIRESLLEFFEYYRIHFYYKRSNYKSKDDYITDVWNSLITQSYINDLWLIQNSHIGNRIRNFDISEFIEDLEFVDSCIEQTDSIELIYIDMYQTGSSQIRLLNYLLDDDKIKFCKKLLLKFKRPVSTTMMSNYENIRYYSVDNFNYDVICKFTDNQKLIEFYSKYKGPAYKINVKIQPYGYDEELYKIDIYSELESESYIVYLNNRTGKTFGLVDVIPITDIGLKSNLVDIKVYNSYLDGELIDDRYLDPDQYNEIYNDELRNISLRESSLPTIPNSGFRDLSNTKLPIGEFTLDRYITEEFDYSDVLKSLNIFRESDYHPDLFIVPEVYNVLSKKFNTSWKTYLDELSEFTDDICTQSLINLDFRQLNEWYKNHGSNSNNTLPSKDNRLLYFFDKFILDDKSYPLFYLYLSNILTQNYLELPIQDYLYYPFELKVGNTLYVKTSGINKTILIKDITELSTGKLLTCVEPYKDKLQLYENIIYGILVGDKLHLISDPNGVMELGSNSNLTGDIYTILSLKDYLKDIGVNYLICDNLLYFYENIREVKGQSSVFMIRYLTSKLKRELLKLSGKLRGNTRTEVRRLISNRINYCISNLKLMKNLKLNLSFELNKCNVSITFEVPKLTNKTYNLNIILNV